MKRTREASGRLLHHLGLELEPPGLDYLHRLIHAHQLRVPFETLTKLIDYEPGVERGDFLPPFEDYVSRIIERGAGGLCWTLAHGFRTLLADLGFDASHMYMDPGHCCVRVELPGGSFYADVGYAAPIFRAYPLFESFSLDTHRETFEYHVSNGGIYVTRSPGPTKTLDPAPRTIESLRGQITAANDWSAPQSFLHRLAYASYVEGVYVSIRDGVLTRYLPSGPERSTVAEADAPALLAEVFGADPELYREAESVMHRHKPRDRKESSGLPRPA